MKRLKVKDIPASKIFTGPYKTSFSRNNDAFSLWEEEEEEEEEQAEEKEEAVVVVGSIDVPHGALG